jgi:3-dehydrosphinganine reductase
MRKQNPGTRKLRDKKRNAASLAGKVVIITGGSSGLGAELAARMGQRGASLALLARDHGRLAAIKERIKAQSDAGVRVEVFPCDVAQAKEVDDTFQAIVDTLGLPDILINSAGILREGYFENQSLRTFREVMDINYFGTLHCIQAVLPLFKRKGAGRIINISSLAGLMGTFGYSAYCSSKHAVVGLTHALRTELKPQNILFHLVCPTEFETPMVVEVNKARTPENEAIVHTIPVSTLDQVADAVMQGLDKNQYLIIPGWATRAVERINRWLPGLAQAVVDFNLARIYRGPGKDRT